MPNTYTPAMTSSSTIPAPPGSFSKLDNGYTFTMSKKRNKRNATAIGIRLGGAIKLATIKPTTSSMTITDGSRCSKISAALVDSHIAQQTAATKVKTAIGREIDASAFKPSDSGTPSSVPAVPGIRGKYPTPKPVAKNSVIVEESRLNRLVMPFAEE